MKPLLVFCLLVVLSTLTFAADKDWRIVPGKRIGQVTIGMERAEVMRLLGVPNREDDLGYLNDNGQKIEYLKLKKQGEYKGILRDDWTVPRKDGYPIMASFVSIYFRDFRVVQIEVSGARFKTTDGLSVKNTATQWEKHFPKFEQSFHKFAHQSADGVPATKIFENYEDDVATGIAWYYGGMGDLAPDPDPDGSVTAVVVHKPGEPVIIDPDGGGRYIYKERPNRLSTDR